MIARQSRFDSGIAVARAARAGAATLAAAMVVLCLGAQAAAAADQGSLVGQWRFDERGGQSAVDDGPFGLDGRLGSLDVADPADPTRVAGLSGGAMHFNGASFVRLPDASELARPTLTVDAVVRAPRSPGAWRYIVSRGGEACFAGAYGLYTGVGGGVAFYVFDGRRYVVSAAARVADVWDGRWHHVAGTFDGRAVRLFVDGRPVGAPANAPLRIDYADTLPTTYFGRYVGDCNLPFVGDVDLVQIWSGALPAEAIAAAAARALGSNAAAAPQGSLTAARGGTSIPASAPRHAKAAPTASSPPRACVVRLSRKRVALGKRTVVRVHVALRRRPLKGVRVVARRTGHPRLLARARTGAGGRARLALKVPRPGRVRVSAQRRDCSSAYLSVIRRAGG